MAPEPEVLHARREFLIADLQRSSRLGISNVIVSPSCTNGDRATDLRFRSNVARHQAARRAARTAIGQQRNGVAQLRNALDGSGHGEHLAHAGAALRAFIANHADIVRIDLAGFDRVEAQVFRIEHTRGYRCAECARARPP